MNLRQAVSTGVLTAPEGNPKTVAKVRTSPPPAVSAQHLLLLTVLLTKVGRFRPYIASKGID